MRLIFCTEESTIGITPTNSLALISITNPGDIVPVKAGWGSLLKISYTDAAYDESTI